MKIPKDLDEHFERAKSYVEKYRKDVTIKLAHYNGYWHVELVPVDNPDLSMSNLTGGTKNEINYFLQGIYKTFFFLIK